MKRILHHLLQVNPVSSGLRKLVALLLDLAHVEQQRDQGPVELTCDLGAGFIHRPGARRGQPDDVKIVVEGRARFDPLREMRIADSVFLL
jgi:hypothetical protein